MPGHLFLGDKYESNLGFSKFLAEIDRIKSRYNKITILLHENSFLAGHYITEFFNLGLKNFKVAVANSNANSLYNLSEIMRTHQDMITNVWGSHISYGLYFGMNVELFVAFDKANEDIVTKDVGLGNLDHFTKLNSMDFYADLNERYEYIFRSLENKKSNKDLGNSLVGSFNKKSPDYLKELISMDA